MPAAKCPNLMALEECVTRQGDDEIPAIGPFYTYPAIVFVGSFHEIRFDMESRPPDLSGIGKALEVISGAGP